MILRTALATIAVVALGGCASPVGGQDAVAQAEQSLIDLRSGHMDLRFTVGALEGDTATAGFMVEGPFALPESGDLPTMELTYTQIAGTQREEVTLTSTGDAAFITIDGQAYELEAAQLEPLRGAASTSGGLDALNLDSWFTEPEASEADGVSTVRGTVDLEAALHGLATFSAGLGAEAPFGAQLDDQARERLAAAVTDSAAELVVEDGTFRHLEFFAQLETAAEVPDEVRGGRFDFSLAITEHNAPVEVVAPADAQSVDELQPRNSEAPPDETPSEAP